jgi:beta-glucosidase
MRTTLLCFITLLLFSAVQAQENSKVLPFRNEKLSPDQRAKDLVSRLTIEEKISLLHATFKGIPRLDIPKYYHGNEALHGIVRPGKFTVFPQAIAFAATWNTDLIFSVSSAISTESRARWNELKQGENQKDLYSDLLTFWSPDINLARDPRWGRTPETYGEDPFLSGRMAVSFIKGLQGDDPKYLKAVATPKHYTANNEEHNRFECNAIMSDRSLREYYLAPFETAIKEGKAESIMSAYNAINGIPCTANKLLLTDILRNEWGFKGYVVSDCGGPELLVTNHKYARNKTEAAKLALDAGLDLECGEDTFTTYLLDAFKKRMVSETQIDSAAIRVLRARFMLGVYDNPESVPYNKISPSKVGCKEHQNLALETAKQSIVLLKNQKNILPLNKKTIKSIAIVGINAGVCEFGDYSGIPLNAPVSILEGIKNKAGKNVRINYLPWVNHEEGSDLIPANCFHLEKSTKKGLKAEYFSTMDLTGVSKSRIDPIVNFDPANQPPDPFIPNSPKSIRWTGILTPKISGEYILSANSDDGLRLYINDKCMIDKWVDRSNTSDKIKISLGAGKEYKVVYEYYDHSGDAIAQLKWTIPVKGQTDFYAKEKKAARESDYVIAVLGINKSIEREGQDKKDLNLPSDQEAFIKELYKVNPKTIVVLVTGSPLSINWIDANIPAIVNAWYPGEQGGNAVADVLFGDYNPAGRLPLTFYKSTDDLLPFDDYEISKGRTYLYIDKKPLYPFGFGLSYTNFEYTGIQTDKTIYDRKDSVEVNVAVKNNGKYNGEEVVQLYVHQEIADYKQPNKQLVAFKRVPIKKGETKTVKLKFAIEQMRHWDETSKGWKVESGDYKLMAGSSSENIHLNQTLKVSN